MLVLEIARIDSSPNNPATMGKLMGVVVRLYGGLFTLNGEPDAEAKVPSPLPNNTYTQIEAAMARSGLPSSLKSATANPSGK